MGRKDDGARWLASGRSTRGRATRWGAAAGSSPDRLRPAGAALPAVLPAALPAVLPDHCPIESARRFRHG